MAEVLSYATTSTVFAVDGATSVDVTITPSQRAYMQFDTSEDGVNWTVLVAGAVYSDVIQRTFTAGEIGNFLRADVYGGIGTVTLEADGVSIPPFVVSQPGLISGTPEIGEQLTLTPAQVTGGVPPYTYV